VEERHDREVVLQLLGNRPKLDVARADGLLELGCEGECGGL
jgi:hypothetical protein